LSQTKYRVLFLDEGGWVEVGDVIRAASANGAIRAALSGVGDRDVPAGGMFVAVPLRSWKPQPVEIETRQQLKIG
jgi:hypothetical protein